VGSERDTLTSIVRDRVRRAPEAIAVDDGTTRLTYRQLLATAMATAAALQTMVDAPGDGVGLCVDRSVWMVAALLGILEAGAAYLPLDPRYPRARLDLMAADGRLRAVVADRAHRRLAADLRGADGRALQVVACPDRVAPADPPRSPSDRPPRPDDAAYVLFTSGSTGRPKGVVVEHRSAANLVHWAGETFSPDDLRRMLAGTSLSWDLSVFEVFAPLAVGGTVVVAPDVFALASPRPPADVTFVNTSPSILGRVLQQAPLPASVRTVALAGEALPADLVRRVQRDRPDVAVWNLYGPTETTTYSTAHRVAGPDDVAIGDAIRGTRLHVVDERGRTVADGDTGELWIGGAGLARGYLDRPDLTAAAFPTGPDGERAYRTGDLVRRDGRGLLWYQGRADDQVKLRGLRIELGEVDAALLAHPDVHEAAAVVVTGPAGGDHLMAAVAGPGVDARVAAEALAHAADHLPSHLVPARVVAVDALPLTVNGKADRAALREVLAHGPSGGRPIDDRPDADADAALPADQQLVADAFAAVLGADVPADPDADLFDLGGDSLTAIALVTWLERNAGVAVPIDELVERSTIAEVADLLGRGSTRARLVRPALVPLRGADAASPLFLAPSFNGHARIYRHLAEALPEDLGVQAMVVPWASEGPPRSIADYGRCLADLVEARQPSGPVRLGGFSFGGLVAAMAGRELHRRGRTVAAVVFLDVNPFADRPAWTVAPLRRLAADGRELAAAVRRGAAADLVRKRFGNLRVKATARARTARPAPAAPAPTSHRARLNRTLALGHRIRPLAFPVIVVQCAHRATLDLEALAGDRRARGPVRHLVVDAPGVVHPDFLRPPTAERVAAVLAPLLLDDDVARPQDLATTRSGAAGG
jgi:amino acid adenylation domain-containing protein